MNSEIAVNDTIATLLDIVNRAETLDEVIPIFDLIDTARSKLKEVDDALRGRFKEEANGEYYTPMGTKIYKHPEVKKKVKRLAVLEALSIFPEDYSMFASDCFNHGAVGKRLGAEYVEETPTDKIVVERITVEDQKFIENVKARKNAPELVKRLNEAPAAEAKAGDIF